MELVSGSGRPLRTVPVPLPSDLGEQGLWSLPELRTPSQSFFIKVTGKDEEGYRFQRLSSVSYTNIIPGKDNPLPADASQRLPLQGFFAPHQSSGLTFHPRFLPGADPPVVSMPEVVKGFYMQPTVIRCSVESDIPYRQRFTRNGLRVGEEKLFQ